MKKFFSAILLMAAMAFSVSTFVSCNDLIEDVEKVTDQAGTNAEAIAALKTQVANLETSLASANAAIDAAKKAADAAAEAAAKAKAEALEALKAEAEALLAKIEANAADVEAVEAEVADLVEKVKGINGQVETNTAAIEAIEVQIAALKEFQKNAEAKHAEVEAAIEALEALKADVEANKADIATLKAKVEELVAKVDTKLVTLVEAMASQIQSVVYVPTTTANPELISTYTYKWGNTKHDVTFLATYEVRPASLVSKIADANVTFSSVPTKVAPAFTIPAEVVGVDATSGRIEVRGRIARNSDVFRSYYNVNDPKTGLAVALNISDKKVVEGSDIDAGTYVSSDFNFVTMPATNETYNATLTAGSFNFRFANPNGYGPAIVDDEYTKTFTVPFGTEESVRNLFPVEIVVNLEGKDMTLEQAAKYLGTELKVSYASNNTTTNYVVINNNQGNRGNGAPKVSPIKVTVPTAYLDATAELQTSPDFPTAKEAEGVSASVELKSGSILINNQATTLTAKSTYLIGDQEASAAVTFETYDAGKWSYKRWNRFAAAYAPTDGITELAVTTSIGLNKLTYDESGTEKDLTNGTSFTLVSEKFTYNDANAWNQQKKARAKATFTVLGNKAVKLTKLEIMNEDMSAHVGYLTSDATYQFRFDLVDDDKNVSYSAAFDLKVGAKPADKTIDLGSYTAGARYANDATVNITDGKFLQRILDTDAAFYTDFITDVNRAEAPYNWPAMYADALKSDVSTIDNTASVGVTANYYTWNYSEASYLTVDKATSPEDTYRKLKVVYTVYGVNYTFESTVNYEKAKFAIAPHNLYVDGSGVVTLEGNVGLPTYASGATDLSSTHFTLNNVDLRDFVTVTGENNVDKTANHEELKLVYTLTSSYVYQGVTYIPSGLMLDNTVLGNIPADINDPVTYNLLPTTQVSAESTTAINATGNVMKLTWGKDNGFNELTFNIALVSSTTITNAAGQVVPMETYGSVDVKVVIPEPLKVETGVAEYQYVGGKTNVGNVVSGLKITDVATGANLYNHLASDLDNMWNGITRTYHAATPTAAAYYTYARNNTANVFDVYGQDVTAYKNIQNTYVAKAYFETTGAEIDSQYFDVDEAGNVTLNMQNANVTDSIIVEVPVMITHDYCGGHVVFTKVKFVK